MGTRGWVGVAIAVACMLGGAGDAAAAPLALVTVASGVSQPDYATGAPGDASRIYVVERNGTVYVVRDGQRRVFADLSALVDTDGDRGLLSIAFPADFASSHRFYAFLTAKPPLVSDTGDLAIARVVATSPDSAMGATPELLVQAPHTDQGDDNGGQLQFGPDGLLYASTGDGGVPHNTAVNPNPQKLDGPDGVIDAGGGTKIDTSPLLGKLLRLDVSGATGATAPASNAFGPADKDPRIWAYGLRDPSRFSFDPATGDLVLGDVGDDTREEVDLLPAGTPAGTNFGWTDWEGTLARTPGASPSGVTFPVLEYPHGPDPADAGRNDCAVIGGYVERDPTVPELAGQYVYADYCASRLRAATLGPGGATGDHDLGLALAPNTVDSFGEDGVGRLLVVGIDGEVSRLVSTAPPAAAGAADHRAPTVLVSGAGTARALLRTGQIAFSVRCDELCFVKAGGRFDVARRSRRAPRLAVPYRTRALAAGVRARIALPVARRTRATLRAALRAHRSVTAKVLLEAKDAAGNRFDRTLAIAVRG